jgi:hypothetical protein
VREFVDGTVAGMRVMVGVGVTAGQTSDGERMFILSLTRHVSCFLITRKAGLGPALLCSDLARRCAIREGRT